VLSRDTNPASPVNTIHLVGLSPADGPGENHVAGYKVTPTKRYGHVVVIRGASYSEFYVHDPEPMNVGTAEWKPQEWLGTVLEIGVFNDVCVNFLQIRGRVPDVWPPPGL
jgi:hypothetical protein